MRRFQIGNRQPRRIVVTHERAPTPYKDIIYRPYNEPAIKDLAIVMVFFNVTNSVRVLHNLLTVKHKLEQANIPYYIAEVAYEDRPFTFQPASNIFQYRSNSYLFYKEQAFSLACKQIPDTYTKFCLLDADIVFDNPNWYSILSTTLNSADVCQPFERAYWLDVTYTKTVHSQPSVPFSSIRIGHPGFVWAVTRKFQETVGLPEFALCGSGDTLFTNCITNSVIQRSFEFVKDKVADYMMKITNVPRISYTPGLNIYHLYHGSLVNRGYGARDILINTFLRSIGKTYLSEITFTKHDGLSEIVDYYRPALNDAMRSYFVNRDDDSI